jgi:hypothetical protein
MSIASILTVAAHQKTERRISAHLHQKGRKEPSTTGEITIANEMVCQARGEVVTKALSSLSIACTTEVTQITEQKTTQSFLETKRKMDQNHTQSSPQSSSREVNHTMQWPSSHPPYCPSYPSPFP